MTTKKLTIKGETVDYAIKTGLQQIGLPQADTLIKIVQKESQGLLGNKEAIVSILYDEGEAEAAIEAKNEREFRSKFQFRFAEGQAQVQVPSCFYEELYVSSQDERLQYLKGYLQENEVEHLNEEYLQKIISDAQCQYDFEPVVDLDTEPLNKAGARIHLQISEDNMMCRAIIFHAGEITTEQVFNVLKKKRVVKGILAKNLQRVLDAKFCGYFTIAKGVPAVDDYPGSIDKFFQEDERKEFAAMMEALTIDTRSIKDINIAERNQLLMRIGDIMAGSDGQALDGSVVTKKEISESASTIKLGQNVYASDSGKEIYSKESGHIVWNAEEKFLDVEPVYIVDGNIDFSEGNIQGFVGKVIVKGDVKPKFSVVAHGDVEIQGTVEDATIRSLNGSVTVLESVIHRNEGLIQARQDINCGIATNAKLESKRIYVAKEAMNSQLKAEKEVIIDGSPGVIIGGTTSAKELIRANTIGSETGVPTVVRIGDVSDLRQRLRSLNQRSRSESKRLKESQEILKILEDKEKKGTLDPAQAEQLEKAQAEIPDIQDDLEYIQSQEEKIMAGIAECEPAQLHVLQVCHPQVDIYLYEGHLIPSTPEKFTGFHWKKGAISRYSLT